MIDPNQIWLGLKIVCDVQSSSRTLALKEEFFSLWLLEGEKKWQQNHIQKINNLKTSKIQKLEMIILVIQNS